MRGPLQLHRLVLGKSAMYTEQREHAHAPRHRYALRGSQNREVRADVAKDMWGVGEHLSANTRCRACHRVSMSWVGTDFVPEA